MKKKTIKILGGAGLLLVLFMLIVAAFFVFSFLQNWLASRIAGYLSKKTGTEIVIDKADFDLFGHIHLSGVLVRDTCGDTLVYAGSLHAKLKDWSLKRHYVFFSEVTAGTPFFFLHIYKDGTDNLSVLLNRLSSPDTTDTTSSSLKILLGTIQLRNGTFAMLDEHSYAPVPSGAINFTDLRLNRIFARINNFRVKDNLYFEVEHLSAVEKSGFYIKHLFAQAFLDSHQFAMNHLKMVTNHSYLSLDSLIFTNPSDNVFSGITSSTVWKAGFNQTSFSLDDINYIAPGTFSGTCPFVLNGYIYGTLSNLHLKNLNILWGDSSYLDISGNISGLPDIDNALFYLNFPTLKTSKPDLDLLIKGFVSDSSFALPKILQKTGTLNYKGNLTGFYNDWVVYGTLKSKLGIIKTDIGLKKEDSLLLQGRFSTEHLKLNALTGVPDSVAGDLSMSGTVNGTIKDNGLFSFDLKTSEASLVLLGHHYRNISVDGILNNTAFDGEVSVKDTALNMVFLGQVDFSDKKPVFYFTADVKHADLNTLLKGFNTSKTDSLKFLLKSKISGNTPADLNGEIELYQTALYAAGKSYPVNQWIMKVDKDTGRTRHIDIQSDILTGQIFYRIKELQDWQYLAENVVKKYYTFFRPEGVPASGTFMRADMVIEKADIFNGLLLPLQVADRTEFSFYANDADSASFFFRSDTVKYAGMTFSGVKAFLNPISVQASAAEIFVNKAQNGAYSLDSLSWDAILFANTANMELSWQTVYDSLLYSGDLQAQAVVNDTASLTVDFIPSYFIIADTMWYINDWSLTLNDSTTVVKDFILNHENEFVSINGTISSNPADSLTVEIADVNLEHFNTVLKPTGISISGKAAGYVKTSSVISRPIVVSDIIVHDFVFDKEKFGQLKLNTSWNNTNRKLFADIYLLRNKLKTIELKGYYDAAREGLDFRLTAKKLLLKHFSPFLTGVLDDFRGLADGYVKIKGTLSHPLTEGLLQLKKVSFTVDYLKTAYSFTAPLQVNYQGIFIKDFDVFDSNGNKAKASFNLTHRNFSNWKYAVTLNTSKCTFLNTTEKDNSLYFGKVLGSGNINIHGDENGIAVNGNVKTETPTTFNLFLESPEDAEEYGFVSFVNSKQIKDTIEMAEETVKKESEVTMDLNIKATKDATVQLIFDSKSGDIIKANGTGDINIKLTQLGDLIIKGEYEIEKGTYLFTLQDMLNKKFEIKKGSYIKWNGDPYKAFLNITAGYKVKTSLYDLTLDSNDRKNVYVECLMYMTNRLDEPEIRFGIDVKSNNPQAKSILSGMSQEEIMKQVIMLMVMGRFYTPEQFRQNSDFYAENGQTGALGMNASELLSEQLSYWLSQITKDFDVGVKYIPGNEISRSELEVALSTQMFNDKVIVNGNVNVGGNVPTASGVAGDVSVELKLNPKGTIRLKGFNRTNDDVLIYQDAPYTQGIGIFYTESFNSLKTLIRKYYTGIFHKIYGKMKKLKRKTK